MRRPRSKLQVSTFPFLAVLLCAMGSLLLLLFMMDRRAKIAAQHQVNALHAERKKRTHEEEETRNAEWENAKERLRQTLLAQQEQLDMDAKGLHGQLDDASKKLVIVHARHNELAQQVKSETAKVGAMQLQIVSQQTGLSEASKKETASKKELLDATKELADLELAFQALHALKARETPVYSLVPYRGKRGDGRAPIYVECVRKGVLFHPEQKLLEGPEFAPPSVRAEVERHAGPLVSAKSAKDKMRVSAEEKTGPYVLFLIRPDGIASYYKASAALAGFQLDFGYELVDQDWALDFNGDPNAKPVRPIQVAWEKNAPKSPGGMSPPALVGHPSSSAPQSSHVAKPPSPLGTPPILGTPLYSGAGPAFVRTSRIASPVPIASTGNAARPPAAPNAGINVSPTVSQGVSPIHAPIPGNNISAQRPAQQETPEQRPADANVKTLPPISPEPVRKTPTPARLIGERDFVITIDCRADRVNVSPGSMPFDWSAGNTHSTDQAFVQAIADLIAKRQASVRPGETPYRPVIRFQVSSAGLRTYYHTYPLLEHLRVPMTRENVED